MSAEADLSVFEKLSAEQIGALTDAFYEAMVKSPSAEKIREAAGGGLDDRDVGRIARAFRGFLAGEISKSDLRRLESSSPAGKDKISAVRAAMDRMSVHNGAYDREAQSMEFLAMFGLKPSKEPVPTIRGMLAHYESDMDATELIREIRDG